MTHNPLEGDRPELTINLHDGSEEQISIIIVHKDRPEYLNICLQSIAVTSFNNNYEIIVVDNGSGKDSQDFLDDIEDEVKVIRNEKNLYWGPAANKGVQAADKGSKYFIFLHCDVVVLNSAWMDLLVNVSESQSAGIVGVELQSYYVQNQKVDFISEWCMLMTRDCWKDIGPFPESLPQIGTSFITTMKAQHKGYKPQVMKNPICHHYRIFSLDINEFERLTENAMTTIPKLMRELQSSPV
jgi:GT2 family glycosyltransferase